MDYFTEDHSKALLAKEWLVKVDNDKATPYLLKFARAVDGLGCFLVITDTKHVWAEVLTGAQFARRWQTCNNGASSDSMLSVEDDRLAALFSLLEAAHTLGGIADLSFEVVPSIYSDFAFQLQHDSPNAGWSWRWETFGVGPKLSAEVLSQHLILPLISTAHLAFYSADPVSELSESDLEKVADKVSRTARRSLDTHVKHAISKPRVATTIRRLAASLNFVPDLQPIVSEADKPDLDLPAARAVSPPAPRAVAKPSRPSPAPAQTPPPPPAGKLVRRTYAAAQDVEMAAADGRAQINAPPADGSATEDDSDDPAAATAALAAPAPVTSTKGKSKDATAPPRSGSASGSGSKSKPAAQNSDSDSDSSPVRPRKKVKSVAPTMTGGDDDDADSETERKRQAARAPSGSAPPRRGGARQPIKRGGKRF